MPSRRTRESHRRDGRDGEYETHRAAVAPDRAHHAASPRRHRRGIGRPQQVGSTPKRAIETDPVQGQYATRLRRSSCGTLRVRDCLRAKHVDVVPNSWPSIVRAFREEDGLQPRLSGKRVCAADSGHALRRTAPRHHHLRCFKGPLPRAPGRAGVAYLESSEIGYSLRVRRVLGARIALRVAAAVLGHL
jgi:hypothetical protein